MMAPLRRILLLLLLFFIFSAAGPSSSAARKPHGFTLKVAKQLDFIFNLYYVNIQVGTSPSLSVNLVLDLASQFPWFDCSEARYNSSSYRPFSFASPKCKLVKNAVPWDCPLPSGVPVPLGCFNNSCGVYPFDYVETRFYMGSLGEDIMNLPATPAGGPRLDAPPLVFSCGQPGAFYPYRASSRGLLGLSKNVLSLPMQLTSAFKLPRKFALCLPSKLIDSGETGSLFIGGGPYSLPPYNGDASNLFFTAPLLINPVSTAEPRVKGAPSDEYFLDVTSIEIDGESFPFKKSLLSIDKKGNGGTKLATTTHTTIMHGSVFEPFVRAFKAKAKARKMVEVPGLAGYGGCFDAKNIRMGITGPDVPVIDLVLKSGGKWRIYGSNSMVLETDRWCLGVSNAGREYSRHAMVIGGLALEDNLLEFDLEASNLRFTSSLLLHKTSCT
ncbi:PREDICTED: basic 7S globulin-like [Tarenaya hassleriana]|uniref:basic 7S globulin-like n=1 Tax=Tarenaya hassleriana TaxID=28532 RepID=UPI00053C2F20|nr:PREDICTED: basic 7S globulin-like [Tarenaya hassleriana]